MIMESLIHLEIKMRFHLETTEFQCLFQELDLIILSIISFQFLVEFTRDIHLLAIQRVKAEESVNLELGGRFSINNINAEIIAYQNNYSNLLGNDLAATGGFGELDPFNAGRALVNGIEFLLKSELFNNNKINFPFSISYTHTNARFL